MGAVAKADAKTNLPAAYDYGDYAGAGFEGTTRDDYAIPFLAILQSNSPQVTAEDSPHRPGMVFNTATSESVKGSEGVTIIPVARDKKYVEWRPRDAGGGIAEVYDPEDPFVRKILAEQPGVGKKKLPNGNELVETFYLYALQVINGVGDPVMFGFASTKIKPYKALMSKANRVIIPVGDRKVRPPLFGLQYLLKTVKQKNTKGEFFNWDVTFVGGTEKSALLDPKGELFVAAANLYESHVAGALKTDLKQQAAEGSADNGAGDGSTAGTDTDIPF